MNRYLFTTIFAMICLSGALFSCEKEPSSEDKAKETAGLFAKYYYTWRLADAISLTDENMELRIRFLSSNVHKADIEVLHGATETPEIEVDDITMEDDSNAIATVSACASSAHAISDALTHIRLGKADMIVTGGSEACVTIPSVGGFNSAQALSTNNDEYMTASRPFDRTRDGFVLGEGAAVLVLEEYEHAKARGAKIYAEVLGAAMSADAHHITAPHPEGDGAVIAMNLALEDAGIKPEDVDYINVPAMLIYHHF